MIRCRFGTGLGISTPREFSELYLDESDYYSNFKELFRSAEPEDSLLDYSRLLGAAILLLSLFDNKATGGS